MKWILISQNDEQLVWSIANLRLNKDAQNKDYISQIHSRLKQSGEKSSANLLGPWNTEDNKNLWLFYYSKGKKTSKEWKFNWMNENYTGYGQAFVLQSTSPDFSIENTVNFEEQDITDIKKKLVECHDDEIESEIGDENEDEDDDENEIDDENLEEEDEDEDDDENIEEDDEEIDQEDSIKKVNSQNTIDIVEKLVTMNVNDELKYEPYDYDAPCIPEKC